MNILYYYLFVVIFLLKSACLLFFSMLNCRKTAEGETVCDNEMETGSQFDAAGKRTDRVGIQEALQIFG